MAVVQIMVDGRQQGPDTFMCAGDVMRFTFDGFHAQLQPAEERIAELQRLLRSEIARNDQLESTIRRMVFAASHEEAVGIASVSGVYRGEW